WSKDEILAADWGAGEHAPGARGTVYLLLLTSAVVTAGLTAFYTFRAYFLTFWGEVRIPPEAGHHAHESPPVMTVPLMILAVGAVGIGLVVGPLTHWLNHLLSGHTPYLHLAGEEHEAPLWLPVAGGLAALSGIAVAWWMYAREPGLADRLATQFRGLYQLSLNKFHFDELYEAFVVKPLAGFAEFCRIFDQYVVDQIVDLIGHVPRLLGALFRPIQNGLVQFYALAMMLGLT